MLTVRMHQHSFSTHQWMFLWKCQSFWDRKCLDQRGTRTPNLRIHVLTIWAIRARHFQSQVFEYWLWWYRYVWSKVSIWNVNCARATAFIWLVAHGAYTTPSHFSRRTRHRHDRKCVQMLCQIFKYSSLKLFCVTKWYHAKMPYNST